MIDSFISLPFTTLLVKLFSYQAVFTSTTEMNRSRITDCPVYILNLDTYGYIAMRYITPALLYILLKLYFNMIGGSLWWVEMDVVVSL